MVHSFSFEIPFTQVPSWEDALYCNYDSSRDTMLAGPTGGQGEGFKYTVPSLGARYFISTPTPCLAASPSIGSTNTIGSYDYNKKCCQKQAIVSVETESNLDTVLEGSLYISFQ